MDKGRLRNLGLKNLKWLHKHPALKERKEQVIIQELFNDSCWQQAQTIAMTKSLEFEFNTQPLLNQAFAENKRVLMPTADKDRRLTFHLITPETVFERSSFGVEEPVAAPSVSAEEIDLLIVPGIVFTHEGYRIGFGGGYYDRFLQSYQGNTCSLVFSEQIQEGWTVEAFDLPVKQLFIS
ncbi:5-formyltetrahydrofolate cyclo-ligase [Erwinia sp. CPCC 100877]|nr:5-formyltetrahydrofolate cyclo-ligase [Erwinia sp. CPCC 100877]